MKIEKSGTGIESKYARAVAPSIAIPSNVVSLFGTARADRLASSIPADHRESGEASAPNFVKNVYSITNSHGFCMTVCIDSPQINLPHVEIAHILDFALHEITQMEGVSDG